MRLSWPAAVAAVAGAFAIAAPTASAASTISVSLDPSSPHSGSSMRILVDGTVDPADVDQADTYSVDLYHHRGSGACAANEADESTLSLQSNDSLLWESEDSGNGTFTYPQAPGPFHRSWRVTFGVPGAKTACAYLMRHHSPPGNVEAQDILLATAGRSFTVTGSDVTPHAGAPLTSAERASLKAWLRAKRAGIRHCIALSRGNIRAYGPCHRALVKRLGLHWVRGRHYSL